MIKGGILINKTGKGRYDKKASVENLIRYIIRDQKGEEQKGGLLSWGAYGAPEWGGAEAAQGAFHAVRLAYTRKGRFVRYIDHEIYQFSGEELDALGRDPQALDRVAREMAHDIYRDGYQVVYAVHKKDGGSDDIHVHLAVNTVSYRDARKRREYMGMTTKRQGRFQRIVRRAFEKPLTLEDLDNW